MQFKLDEALDNMILSASGWRSIFAGDNDEESPSSEISLAHKIIAAVAAKVFSDYLGTAEGAVIVGMDTRPTGSAIADAVIRSLLASGREVRYVGIVAAPEIMALARSTPSEGLKTAGFIYISASHNPIGHNGIKFGLTDGGVLQADETGLLILAFKAFLKKDDIIEQAQALFANAGEAALEKVYTEETDTKKTALSAYREFTSRVVSDNKVISQDVKLFATIKKEMERRPLGIVADFNGSARTVSIDRDFFASLGVRFYSINDKPGEIAHRIVPEGESLDPCRFFLEELHQKDKSIVLGYMSDCDGDRGNLVIWDEAQQMARILEAQEVFALACIAELSYLVWKGDIKYDNRDKALTPAALVVNDATSLRINRIADIFGVDVFRAEVGEANVVGLARKLRKQGYIVRILGEGSAGGVIIHPSAVRDPIDTLGAILKLLALRSGQDDGSGNENLGLFRIWLRLSGKNETFREDFSLTDIITSLPAFITTGAYTEDAVLKVKTSDHGLLKDKYQKIFQRDWEEKKTSLMKYGISKWEAISYNGIEERRGITRFGDAGRGGLKIEFSGSNEKIKTACIWMRGSGTEPVFRVMADAEGPDPYLERMLIDWQRKMVQEADV